VRTIELLTVMWTRRQSVGSVIVNEVSLNYRTGSNRVQHQLKQPSQSLTIKPTYGLDACAGWSFARGYRNASCFVRPDRKTGGASQPPPVCNLL